MKSRDRWEIAQKYEKGFWKGVADTIAADAKNQLTWYSWKADEFEKKLFKVRPDHDRDNCTILEVGSGPIGIVSRLKWGKRYAIDPLADFYKESPHLVQLRNDDVTYLNGTGEALPFPDGHFSLVILDNVLDHVSEPGAVLDEINRVLAKNAVLFFEVNIHTYWGYILHSILSTLRIDKGHPHSYTQEKIRAVLRQHRFIIDWDFAKDYYQARAKERQSDSLKHKIKGYTGLSEFVYSAVCRRE